MFCVRDKERPEIATLSDYFPTREEAEAHVATRELHKAGVPDPIPGHEYLEIVEVERENRPCEHCGAQVQANDVGVTYCRGCHYMGTHASATRAEQISRFYEALGADWIGVEHTGGGCFWLAFRWDDDPKYYVTTDGEASLPAISLGEDGHGRTIWEDVTSGGWGYVGRHDDTEPTEEELELGQSWDDVAPDYNGTVLRIPGPPHPQTPYDKEAPEWVAFYAAREKFDAAYPEGTLSDEDVIEIIRADRKRRGIVERCRAWLEVSSEKGFCTRPADHEGIHSLRTKLSSPPYETVV